MPETSERTNNKPVVGKELNKVGGSKTRPLRLNIRLEVINFQETKPMSTLWNPYLYLIYK